MDRYEIQLDRNNVQEIYEYDYSQLNKDSVKKEAASIPKLVPVLRIGDSAVVFLDQKTNEKYYLNSERTKVVSQKTGKEYPVPADPGHFINYRNSLNVKDKIFNHQDDITATEEEEPETKDDGIICLAKNLIKKVAAKPHSNSAKPHSNSAKPPSTTVKPSTGNNLLEKINSLLPLNNNTTDDAEQEEQEEEEPGEKPNQLKAKLKDTGFSKSFILSLIYELGSKDLKVKLIEDQTESIEDKDIDKLKELANEDSIIFEEEQPELSCPKLPESINCPGDSYLGSDADGCPKLFCNPKIKTEKINSETVSQEKMVFLIILLMLFIIGTVFFVIKMKFV